MFAVKSLKENKRDIVLYNVERLQIIEEGEDRQKESDREEVIEKGQTRTFKTE